MHEGASTRMGLPGLSEKLENLRIRRDLDILRYLVVDSTSSHHRRGRAAHPRRQGRRTFSHLRHHRPPPLLTDEDLQDSTAISLPFLALSGRLDRPPDRRLGWNGRGRPTTAPGPRREDADFMVVAPGIAGLHAVGSALCAPSAITAPRGGVEEAMA